MTDNNHPITPPDGLVTIWTCTPYGYREAARWGYDQAINELKAFLGEKIDESPATELAQKIADQELEACCEWMADETPTNYINALRAARRPKPPRLKEQALERCNDDIDPDGIIRRALESLPD